MKYSEFIITPLPDEDRYRVEARIRNRDLGTDEQLWEMEVEEVDVGGCTLLFEGEQSIMLDSQPGSLSVRTSRLGVEGGRKLIIEQDRSQSPIPVEQV